MGASMGDRAAARHRRHAPAAGCGCSATEPVRRVRGCAHESGGRRPSSRNSYEGQPLRTRTDCAGFSLIELLIAMTITLGITAAVCAMLSPASGAFQVVPEAADVRQRLWASIDVVSSDLLSAGTQPVVS